MSRELTQVLAKRKALSGSAQGADALRQACQGFTPESHTCDHPYVSQMGFYFTRVIQTILIDLKQR